MEAEAQDAENAREIRGTRRKLDDENEAIVDLEALHDEVTKCWSNIKLHHNIGHVQYAVAITVDEGGTLYTSDWAAFLAAEAKVKDQFEGNVVDLGAFRLIFLAFTLSNIPPPERTSLSCCTRASCRDPSSRKSQRLSRMTRFCAHLASERIVVLSLPREIDAYQQQTYRRRRRA
jgi:hypothetical protein